MIRPRLVVARRVLAECPPEELAAILAHERRHFMQRDNLRRALLACLPDLLALAPMGDRLVTNWHDAIEEAADDAAAENGPAGRVDLASALVRVARLAPTGQRPVVLPVSALYRGENIERRVRRLLDDPEPPSAPRGSAWRRGVVGACLVVMGGLALHATHEVVEAAASFLP